MKKLLVGVIGLGWALAAQPDDIDLSGLKFREHALTWLNVELTEPRSFGYGGREPHRDPLVESRMHHVDKVFERLELKIRDDKLHEGIVKKKNLRKRYRELFPSQEQGEFRQADAEAEFWYWVRRYKKEQSGRRLEFNIERPGLPGKKLLLPFEFAHPAIPGIELDE